MIIVLAQASSTYFPCLLCYSHFTASRDSDKINVFGTKCYWLSTRIKMYRNAWICVSGAFSEWAFLFLLFSSKEGSLRG